MKTKITIIDCENSNHCLSLMVPDCMTLGETAYSALRKHRGLSANQIAKIEAFEASCSGPIMVNNAYFCDNDADLVAEKTGLGNSYRAYAGENYMHILHLTQWEGHRDRAYIVPKACYVSLDHTIANICCGKIKETWHGERIQ